MARQTINIGSSPNAGDGDALRVAFGKINANFTESYAATATLGSSKQPLDGTLTALAAVTFAADKGLYATGADAFATYDLTAYGRSLGAAASAAAAKTLLALAAADITNASANGRSLLIAANYAAMRTLLGLVVGTDVQAYSANLAAFAGKTAPSGAVVGTTDTQTLTNKTLTSPVLGAASATSINGLSISASTGTLAIANAKVATVNNTLTLSGVDGAVIPFGSRTRQVFTSGSGTYTTPANVKYIAVRLLGGGGGGSGSGTTPGAGGAGGDTTFSTFTAGGGGAAVGAFTRGAGGVPAGGGSVALAGSSGGLGISQTNSMGVGGGSSFFGATPAGYGNGASGAANTGAGGGGAGTTATAPTGAGGGGGAYVEAIILSPSPSYSYGVGAGGAGGPLGTGGSNGGNGGSGLIIVDEFYQ